MECFPSIFTNIINICIACTIVHGCLFVFLNLNLFSIAGVYNKDTGKIVLG